MIMSKQKLSLDPLYIPTLAVVGVGLIGGSLTLALKAAGVVGEVVGVDLDPANLAQAQRLGVIDRGVGPEGVAAADLVCLTVPVQAMAAAAAAVIPHMRPGAVLTDGGSVKGAVVRDLAPLLNPAIRFVPGHPISGTERSGAEAAFATLYQGKRCILTPVAETDPEALELVSRMWQAAGSEVVLMEVEKHDRILAAISHLPHMVAYSLVNAVGSYDRYEENVLAYSAGGFRDFTRIASSDPVMWRDIALTNREALLEMIERFEQFLGELKTDIVQGDGERLHEFFQRSKSSRDAIL